MKCVRCQEEVYGSAKPVCETCLDKEYISILQQALVDQGVNPFSRTFRERYLKNYGKTA